MLIKSKKGFKTMTNLKATKEEHQKFVSCFSTVKHLHPKLYKVNKQTLRIFKQKFLEFTISLRDNLYYEHCYADTKKGRWVKFLTNNKAKPVGEGIEGILYEYELI